MTPAGCVHNSARCAPQATMWMASWVTAPTMARTYPQRCPPAQSPAGSRSRPASTTRVDWLLAAARTGRRTAGVSRRLRPALNPPQRQGQRPRMQRRHTPVQSRCRDLAGYNNDGQLGDDSNSGQNVPTPVSDSDVPSWLAISAGDAHTCGLAAGGVQDGKAYCWGEWPPAPRPEPSKAAGAATAHAAAAHAGANTMPRPRR
jgi:hypothetical protein